MSQFAAPEAIERTLTRAILRGEHPPGRNLPPLRRLAEDFGVNPSTMQRALARLEAKGLVTARQGSGLRVNDPDVVGDMALVPDLLAALDDDPDRAATVLEELLEVRRVLAARLIARHRDAVRDALGAIAALATGLGDAAPEVAWRQDLAVARAIVGVSGNHVVLALLRSVEQCLAELPLLVAAMYEDPSRNEASILEVLAALDEGGPALAARVEAAAASVDAATVEAYRRALAATVSAPAASG